MYILQGPATKIEGKRNLSLSFIDEEYLTFPSYIYVAIHVAGT